jgi:serine protease AprX
MKQTYILMITVALLLASTAVLADATDDKLAADLKGRIESGGTHRVIVSHDASFGSSDLDALRNRGERLRRNHPGIGGFSADLSSEAIEDLASDPRVLSISPDRKVVGNLDVTVPTVGADTIADELGYAGKGVTVALIDSGITPTSAIHAGRLVASVDFTDSSPSNVDAFGHGTHIAGIIGGSGRGTSDRGIAPKVTWHPHHQPLAGTSGRGVVPKRSSQPRGPEGVDLRIDGHRLGRQSRARRPPDDQHTRKRPVRADRRRDERPEHRSP